MVNARVTRDSKQETIDLVGGSTFGRYSKISAAKTLNMYVTTGGIEKTENQENWLVGFFGYQRILNLIAPQSSYTPPLYPDQAPPGTGRGIFRSIRGNFMLVVINSTVYSIDDSLAVLTIGNLNTSSGEVFMDENLNNQVCIVDGTAAWIYDYGTNVFAKQTTGDLGSGVLLPNYVEFHNGFFLFGNANQGSAPLFNQGSFWFIYQYNKTPSGTNDLIIEPATAFSYQVSTKPDSALAVKRIPGRSANVLVFGRSLCEVWTSAQSSTTYYTFNPSLSINYGCESVSTIAEGADILVWLGVNEEEAPVICVYDGEKLTNISTDGIDDLLGTLVAPQTSTASLYRDEGHLFYILTFYDPRDNLTLAYDFNTGLFSNLTNQDLDFFPARGIVYFNLTSYFISLRNAALYELSAKYDTYNENLPLTSASAATYNTNLVYTIPRIRTTSNVRLSDAGRFIVNSLSMTLEQGCDPNYTGASGVDYLITEDGFNPSDSQMITEFGDYIVDEDSGAPAVFQPANYIPRIDLRFSKDGGVTWSNYVSRNLNPLGFRQNQLHWEGMGVANDICFQFNFLQTNRLIVNNAQLDIIP